MRSALFTALAVAPVAFAQFGMGENGSPLGGYGSPALAACSAGDNAGCSAYITSATKCYQIMVDGGSEADAFACACDPNSDFLSAFKTCADCVAKEAGIDSGSSSDYASQFADACRQSKEVDDVPSSSTSAAGASSSATATDISSSSSALSTGAQVNATATTEVVGASPTGAGARELVGVAGMVGMAISAMVLVA